VASTFFRALHDRVQRARALGAREVARRLRDRVLRHVWWSEQHVWYVADTHAVRGTVPDGFRLRRVVDRRSLPGDVSSVGLRVATAVAWLAVGGELWVLENLASSELAFACWIFRERAPALAARGGWFRVPPACAVLEDSFTAVSYRGRGLAPAAWRCICADLAASGVRALLTKVEVANTPSRRACEKAGFREVAAMRFRRRLFLRKVHVTGSGTPVASLRQALAAESG